VSVTTQPTTFSDLYTLLLNAVRADTSATGTISQAKRAINMALYDMHLGMEYKYPWAERAGRLITQAQYTTGTCSITKGATALTGSSTLWNTANSFGVNNVRANGKFIIGGLTPYVVSSISSDTALTLSSRFTESTITAGTYVYFEDEYDLASDFLRPVDMQRFSDDVPVELISRTEFRRRYPANAVPGRPTVACLIDSAPSGNTTPIRRVKFHQPPDTNYTIPYTYITSSLAVSSAGAAQANLSADSDEPIVPLRYRHAIFYYALAMWYRDKKDDIRSEQAKSEYTDIMLRVTSDVEVGGTRPQIRPRVSAYARKAQRPWSGRGNRRYDINGKFDRME
jgi:hypothetical protein